MLTPVQAQNKVGKLKKRWQKRKINYKNVYLREFM